jgi:hypothetical protein
VTFGVATSTDLGPINPAGQVVADFNQDGHLDLLVTSSDVNLFAGDGTGSFSLARDLFFGQAGAAAVADFNGDGYPDVVVAQNANSQSSYGFVCSGSVTIALVLGPSLLPARCLASPGIAFAAQSGDFNGDGRPDIAVAGAAGSGLWIYSGHYFDFPYTVNITSVPGGNIAATSMAPPVDLNGDGKLDLFVGFSGGVKTFLGNGDGTFSVPVGGIAVSNTVAAVAVGFLNGDARPDIAWIESGANGRLLVGFGAGNGTFSTQVVDTVTTASPGLTDVSIADVDHDGRQDIVVADKGNGKIRIYFGNGDGTFVANPPLALTVKPRFLAARDWDEDGDPDLGIIDSGVGGLNALAWIALQEGSGPTDVTAPTVALTSPAAGSNLSGTVAVTATASDDVGVTRVEFFAGNTLIGKSAGPSYMVSWNTAAVPNGPVMLTARAVDAAHNESASAPVEVTIDNVSVPDTTPPVVTVPASATIEATSPAGAVFTYTASATDNIDGVVPVTCAPASGSTFPLGVTTVTCTATDTHGNTGSASFTATAHRQVLRRPAGRGLVPARRSGRPIADGLRRASDGAPPLSARGDRGRPPRPADGKPGWLTSRSSNLGLTFVSSPSEYRSPHPSTYAGLPARVEAMQGTIGARLLAGHSIGPDATFLLEVERSTLVNPITRVRK